MPVLRFFPNIFPVFHEHRDIARDCETGFESTSDLSVCDIFI